MGLTFSLYNLPDGGSPLWVESQKAQLDEQGHYSVTLGAGSANGLPLDLFTSGKALWLGVQPQISGTVEQPRILLVAVPYALKAVDADTLGGKPASAYATLDAAAASSATPSSTSTATGGAASSLPGNRHTSGQAQMSATTGTQNFVAKFIDTTNDLGNSLMAHQQRPCENLL